jgi:hypothetical protein
MAKGYSLADHTMKTGHMLFLLSCRTKCGMILAEFLFLCWNLLSYVMISLGKLNQSKGLIRRLCTAGSFTIAASFANSGGIKKYPSSQSLLSRRLLLSKALLSSAAFPQPAVSVEVPVHGFTGALHSAIDKSKYDVTVEKGLLDDRDYKSIILDNGLRVLLVSDHQSERAAVAVDVHVGYFSDPSNLPGLAHFCEHMTFLGTKKYPQEDDFAMYLSAHGGSSNAYTDAEDTVYVRL